MSEELKYILQPPIIWLHSGLWVNVREKEEECGQVVLKKIIDLGRKKVERVVTANKQSSNNSNNKGHWRHKEEKKIIFS